MQFFFQKNSYLIHHHQVFRATQKYRARAHDELSVNIGDHIVATEMAVNNADEEGGEYLFYFQYT